MAERFVLIAPGHSDSVKNVSWYAIGIVLDWNKVLELRGPAKRMRPRRRYLNSSAVDGH